LTWRRLTVFCRQLAQMPGTALWRQLRGVDADWTVDVALLARATHALEVANWQRGADPKEGRQKKFFPPPILSPGEQVKKAKPKQSVGKLLEFRARANYQAVEGSVT